MQVCELAASAARVLLGQAKPRRKDDTLGYNGDLWNGNHKAVHILRKLDDTGCTVSFYSDKACTNLESFPRGLSAQSIRSQERTGHHSNSTPCLDLGSVIDSYIVGKEEFQLIDPWSMDPIL